MMMRAKWLNVNTVTLSGYEFYKLKKYILKYFADLKLQRKRTLFSLAEYYFLHFRVKTLINVLYLISPVLNFTSCLTFTLVLICYDFIIDIRHWFPFKET